MPSGQYGSVHIGGSKWAVVYWSSFKSDCEQEAGWQRAIGKNNARIVRHPIKKGTLAGGITEKEWAVAIRKRE